MVRRDGPLVSVIIVNYKEYELLANCLDSVMRSSYQNLEVIVVDNESDHYTLSSLSTKFPQAKFFPQQKNLRYAEGNNFGIKKAEGEFFVLLNNDTVVEKSWLEPLVREAIQEPRALYQPKILLMDKRDVVFSLGCNMHLFGIGYPIGIGRDLGDFILPRQRTQVFYCVGACLMGSRSLIQEIGDLDSNYWTYFEDVNFGWKALLFGYKSYLVPDSTIFHKWGGTYGQQLSERKTYLLERGRVSSILRNYSFRTILILLPIIFILDLAIIIYLSKHGLGRAKIRASKDVILNLRYIVRERKKIQRKRIITDKELSRHLSTTVDHPFLVNIAPLTEEILVKFTRILISVL